MLVLSTQEESSTRTTLEIGVPAEEVEKAFRVITRADAKRAAPVGKPWRGIPGR